MKVEQGIPIVSVFPDSIAADLGLLPGDELLSIEGQLPKDYIDFVYLTSDDCFRLVVLKASGAKQIFEVEREPGEELGFQLEGIIYDGLRECANHCIFCFVHQMPEGLRETLSLKDDDYRFSFLQGSFITLTNLQDSDVERIKLLKLSPLYVSVHTTNPKLRQQMMGSKEAGKIMDILRDLHGAGIDFHAQIVLCPGINDGDELKRSIEDLASLRPNLLSLAVVPVGLTRYREKLYQLRNYTVAEAEEVFNLVRDYQERFLAEGENFLYLSDEFYLLTGKEFPESEEYNDFPQLENGVGLSRLLLDEFADVERDLPERLLKPLRLLLATGLLAENVLKKPVARLNQIDGLTVDILPVRNEFFGEKVTVAGLLTGRDIRDAILEARPEEYELIVLPRVVLNDDGLFIDSMTKSEFIADIPNAIFVNGFYHLFEELEGMNFLEVE